MLTEKRKMDHLKIALEKKVEHNLKLCSFEEVMLEYDALPEMKLQEVNLKTEFLGKKFEWPLMVSAITGGTKEAEKINKEIASACEKYGIGFGLGSQRAMLENEKLCETFYVRDVAPNIFIAGNIGVSQLKEYSVQEIQKMLKDVGADALAVHLNPEQEAIQLEGTPDFTEGIKGIERLARKLSQPVYVKGVGHGISKETARKLKNTGIKAIDVQGAGGTSWTAIEALRGNEKGKVFWNFGIPTPVSVLMCKKQFDGKIIASGGIRNGLDCVKGIVLGADLAGIALPALKARQKGKKHLEKYLENFLEEIRIASFLVGAKNLGELKKKKYYLLGNTYKWIKQNK